MRLFLDICSGELSGYRSDLPRSPEMTQFYNIGILQTGLFINVA